MTALGDRVLHRPVSAAQSALWAEQEYDPGTSSSGYFAVAVTGPLDPGRLRRAALAVLHRHEPLRSVLRVVDGELRQVVLDADDALSYDEVAVPCEAGAEREAAAAFMAAGENRRRWDLAAEGPVRFHGLAHAPDRRTVVFSVHHAGFDGRSKFVVAADFARALTDPDGLGPPLDAAHPADAPDEVCAEAAAFWTRVLPGVTGPLLVQGGREPGRTGVRSTATTPLAERDVAALRELAAGSSVSTFTALLAALARQLAWYGNDVAVLAIAADVSDETTRGTAGVQVNVVPLVLPCAADRAPGAALAEADEALARMRRFRRVPFRRLLAEVPDRSARRLMTQFGLSFPRPPRGLRLDVPGLDLRWDFFTANTSATFDKTLQVRADWPRGLVRLDYRPQTMDAAGAEAFAAHFHEAVRSLARSSGAPVARGVPSAPAEEGPAAPWVAVPAADPLDPPVLRPTSGRALAVLGPDGGPAHVGVPGALVVSDPADGSWADTGEEARVRPDGAVEHLGPRATRWLRHHGFIDAPLVARVLRAHPGVRDARVEVRDTGRRGPVAVAEVEPADPARPPGVGELRAHLRDHLDGFDLPGRIALTTTP
ncbi:condensation domain-containing protein [Saccharothrix sp. BKS2]|uniref:condensation domain-containing protein n=1 Tax=Saccharothrix sp. BKS2 TaxID=3064400 RepID=UPI0039EA68EB